jgi:hypothetical protein
MPEDGPGLPAAQVGPRPRRPSSGAEGYGGETGSQTEKVVPTEALLSTSIHP